MLIRGVLTGSQEETQIKIGVLRGSVRARRVCGWSSDQRERTEWKHAPYLAGVRQPSGVHVIRSRSS